MLRHLFWKVQFDFCETSHENISSMGSSISKNIYTVEHIYDACPKYSELGSFRIIAYLYVSDGSRR